MSSEDRAKHCFKNEWTLLFHFADVLFELCLFKHFSPVANFGYQSLGVHIEQILFYFYVTF